MALTLGIDIGSTTSKCVLLKDGTEIIGTSLMKSGTGTKGPEKAFRKILEDNNLKEEDLDGILATGYGRKTFKKAKKEMSELSCHGKGVYHLFPSVRTIIDIGGQDAKVIRLNEQGQIDNFVMNDKCAAGTGRFLDVMSGIFGIEINEMEAYALEAETTIKISNTCTVFAESEVISQLSNGVKLENLIAGICQSVATRVIALAKRVGVKEAIFMSGGVAGNGGVRTAIAKGLDSEVITNEYAQYMGALGAAIYAYEKK